VPSTKFGVEIFNRVAWTFGPCIAACPYLRPVLTIDTGFLSGRYTGKLFIACGYDAEQQLLPLAFAVVAGEENMANWGWFMQWLRKEVVGPGKIIVISYQHLGIRAVFERPDFG
jgi:MULE transposase domain